MFSITIISIVVVALLTLIIFGLTWMGFKACLRLYRVEVTQGKYDTEIIKEFSHKGYKIIGTIVSIIIFIFLSTLFVIGFIYKINNENFTINNKTILVVKSDSMADFYDDKYAETLDYDRSLQFSIGDICVFEKVSEDAELIKGEVYGYKYKNIIVTHRLVKVNDDGTYEFRGDNNSISDVYHIKKDSIVYHYTGTKIKGLGAFVLYAQSYFGIWSLIGMIGITTGSEIILKKIDKWNKKRYNIIKGEANEKN